MVNYPAEFPCPHVNVNTSGTENLIITKMASGRDRARRISLQTPPDRYSVEFRFGINVTLCHAFRAWVNNTVPESIWMKIDESEKQVIFTSTVLPITRRNGFYTVKTTLMDYVA